MDSRTGTLETQLRTALAERVGADRYGIWFGEGVRLGVDGDALVVGVPNGFFREWIRGHYSGSLIETAQAVAGRPLRLDVRVDAEAEPTIGNIVPDPVREERPTIPPVVLPPTPSSSTEPTAERSRERLRGAPGRPLKRLEDFVTGSCNRLAHAAAVEMVGTLGTSFNPLVIHGGIGLGKSHLLEGVASAMRARHPGLKLVHMSAETFTNSFLDALRNGSLPAFRARYRNVSALVLDDVHFLAAKRATQDEFLHTFNALTMEGAPMVLACDQHPRLVARLTDELATRFLGGMVVKLDAPDLETRKAILRVKAAARGVELPEAVVAYVAEHLRASVRELEGALHSLIAHASLSGRRLDLALARTALRDTIRHTAQAVALKDIEQAICRLFNLDHEALRTDSRARAVAHPRMLAMYLARRHTGASYSEIGRFFGGRNHSTVISAEKKVLSWLKDEQRCGLLAGFESLADLISSLERSLGS